MMDIFYVPRGEDAASYRARIIQKHIDYLLCDCETMKPLCGIELDDRSHSTPTRRERDEFVDTVFETAGLPLARVVNARSFEVMGLQEYILGVMKLTVDQMPLTTSIVSPDSDNAPICPKCDIPMVLRKSRNGEFWGCSNYPHCRQIIKKH